MIYTATPPLVSDADQATVIQGDCRLFLPDLGPVGVLMSDPPYNWFAALEDLEVRGRLVDTAPADLWPVYGWLWQWLSPLLMLTHGSAWLTLDRRYLPLYQSLIPGTQGTGVWDLPGDPNARLIYVGPEPTAEPDLSTFRYGSDSPAAFWSALLAVTPMPEVPVLIDPFCGTGSTLEAGLRAGYRVIGIDREPAMVQATKWRLEGLTR